MTTTGSWIARDACDLEDCSMRQYQHRHLADGTPEPAVADPEMQDGVARATDPAAGGDLAALRSRFVELHGMAGIRHRRETWADAITEIDRRLAAAAVSEVATEGGELPEPLGDLASWFRAAAAGRREYAEKAPQDQADVLQVQASVLDGAARLASGDTAPMHWWLPSWRWGELWSADRPVEEIDRNRHGLPVYSGDDWTVEADPQGDVHVFVADDSHPGAGSEYVFEPDLVAAIATAGRARFAAATRREQGTAEAATEGGRSPVRGRCPNCGRLELLLGEGGHITCSAAECDDPGMADDLLASAQRWGDRVRLVREPDGPVGALPGADEVGRALALHELGDPSDTEIDQRRKLAARVLAVVQERHRCASPAPEVVSGAEAADLPRRSIVVMCKPDGTPWAAAVTAQRLAVGWKQPGAPMIDRLEQRGTYRVLYRAPDEPAPPLAVGDVVETASDLDRLPVGTALRAPQRGRAVEKLADGFWYRSEDPEPVDLDLLVGGRVLDVPTS